MALLLPRATFGQRRSDGSGSQETARPPRPRPRRVNVPAGPRGDPAPPPQQQQPRRTATTGASPRHRIADGQQQQQRPLIATTTKSMTMTWRGGAVDASPACTGHVDMSYEAYLRTWLCVGTVRGSVGGGVPVHPIEAARRAAPRAPVAHHHLFRGRHGGRAAIAGASVAAAAAECRQQLPPLHACSCRSNGLFNSCDAADV
jgi:hypothetical protein